MERGIQGAIERMKALPPNCASTVDVASAFMGKRICHVSDVGGFISCLTQLLDHLDASDWDDECLEMMGLVRLPKDMDGEAIHINDAMVSTTSGKVFIVKRLKYSEKHGWMIGGACTDDLSEYNLYAPDICRHHHAPTVEELLRQFADVGIRIAAKHGIKAGEFSFYADEDAVAEYAQKIKEVVA